MPNFRTFTTPRETVHSLGVASHRAMTWRCLRPEYIVPSSWHEMISLANSTTNILSGTLDCVDYAMRLKVLCAEAGLNSVGVVLDDDAAHAYCALPVVAMPGRGVQGMLMQLYDPFERAFVRVGQTTPDGQYQYTMETGMVLL